MHACLLEEHVAPTQTYSFFLQKVKFVKNWKIILLFLFVFFFFFLEMKKKFFFWFYFIGSVIIYLLVVVVVIVGVCCNYKYKHLISSSALVNFLVLLSDSTILSPALYLLYEYVIVQHFVAYALNFILFLLYTWSNFWLVFKNSKIIMNCLSLWFHF